MKRTVADIIKSELHEPYPEAKIILTMRDVDAWWEEVR